MSEIPLVSIICISMNHERYVGKGLRSFIDQTYQNTEILYLDNASSDATFTIAKGILDSTNRPVKYFQRETGHSLPANFNYLVKQASGKYYCFISCDDWMQPAYIETVLGVYLKNEAAGLVYSNGWFYYEKDDAYVLAENKKFTSGKMFDQIFLYGVLFPPGVMIRREVFEAVGFYDETIPIEDYDYWLRVAQHYEIAYSGTPLLYYRKHSSNMTSQYGYQNIKYYLQIAGKYQKHPLYNRVCRKFRQFLIYENLLKKEYKKALTGIIKDFRFERFYFSVLSKMIFGKK